MQVDASSTYFGPVPCPCDLVPMGQKQEKEVFHETHLMELDENYEEPLESKDLKGPEFSMERTDLKSPKVFSEDLDLNSPSFSMEPSMKRRKKHLSVSSGSPLAGIGQSDMAGIGQDSLFPLCAGGHRPVPVLPAMFRR